MAEKERRALTALRGPGGERGMILVLTLVVLLVLSMLAGASLINGLLVRSQARTEANAAIALHAAEAGVAVGMAWLSNPANIDNYPTDPDDVPDPTMIADAYTTNVGWQAWTHTLAGTFGNGGHYDGTVSFKRERRDLNGDGDCCDKYPDVPIDEDSEFRDGDANSCSDCPGDIILFNAGSGDGHFGFPSSFYAGTPRQVSGNASEEGYPVLEIVSVGTHGASAVREVALFVARNHKAQVEGALTSRTPVEADIGDHTSGDIPGSLCGDDLPEYSLDSAIELRPGLGPLEKLPCDANWDGECTGGECSSVSTCPGYFDPNRPGKRELGKTPWDVLGMTEVDFRSFFSPQETNSLDTGVCGQPVNLWFTGDLTDIPNNATCQGILVVHNPRFNPDRWDPESPSYDAVYAGNPENGPAVIDTDGGGGFTWNGIIIVDFIRKINANLRVNGGVISLASGGLDPGNPANPVKTGISGSFEIFYSCDAVASVTKRVGYKKKIGWQRVR